MRNFTVKGLITLVLTSSTLLLTPMRSDAQVNINRLTQVAKGCQEDIRSFNYYKRMGFDTNNINEYLQKTYNQQEGIKYCIHQRYHYSLVLTKYPWLDSTGEILPGYPGSVVVSSLAILFKDYNTTPLLDCIINQNVLSQQCSSSVYGIAIGTPFKNLSSFYSYHLNENYAVNVCPSCIVAHDEISGSKTEIIKAFIKWFLALKKTQRRELISLLGDGDEANDSRQALINQSSEAVNEYSRVRARVQEQEQEQRRQELLGN